QFSVLNLTNLLLSTVTRPSSAIDIRADTEVIVENGTAGVLHCSFKSNQVVSSATSVTWSFQSSQPDNQLSKDSYTILYFAGGKAFPGQEEFKDRVHFIGDINKRDVSIQLNPVHFSDNGTYFCDVKNPPDVEGTRARTELRVVLRGGSILIQMTQLGKICWLFIFFGPVFTLLGPGVHICGQHILSFLAKMQIFRRTAACKNRNNAKMFNLEYFLRV
uniref:Ig-like domain-containing protein n=1 Tax=Periophthalmus magnuspinnatus TaxID=409849 RepID=A0A3B3ZYD1_9GOBI